MSGVVAVAGAGGALGPAVVRELAAGGWTVHAADVDTERIAALNDVATLHAADLMHPGAAGGWADAVGPVDAVLHLVGGWRGGKPLHETAPEDIDLLEGLLWRTVVNVTRAFAPALIAAGERGRFALVSSAQAQKPSAGNAAYAATKAAAEAWTLAFGRELAKSGGTANVVVVNALVTPEQRAAEPEKTFATFTDVEEVAKALAYVASSDARKMNAKRLELNPL